MGLKQGPRTVLYVANAAKIGGGNKVLIDLILNLDPSRYSAHIVSPDRGPLTEWAASARVPWSVSPAGDWYGARGTVRLLQRSFELARLIIKTGAPIVHAAAPFCYRAAGLAGALTRTRRVCHLGFPPEPGELTRAFIAGPDVVIGCYEGQAREHETEIHAIAPRCRVVGVPNGVDTTRYGTSAPAADVEQLRVAGGPLVAILGHISDVKGYPTFIDAAALLWERFPNARFVGVGGETTQPGALALFERRVRDAGLSGRFHFLGFRNDVAAVLGAVDIVCLPSLAEGFPLAALEAMASGKPLVATPVGGVPEAISHDRTGLLVRPADSGALAEAIASLIASPERRQILGREARRLVEERFSVGRFAVAIQGIYDRLLANLATSLTHVDIASVPSK